MKKFETALRRNSADAEARTVEVIFTTGAAVRRHRIDGYAVVPFDEVLEVSEKAVDLSRLNAGAPVLDNHRAHGSAVDQLAVVERAWIESGRGLAVLRFPEPGVDQRADAAFEKIRDNIIRNISVGYRIEDYREEPATGKDDVERRIATRWEPLEISLVGIGADPAAQVRSGAPAGIAAARRVALRQARLNATA